MEIVIFVVAVADKGVAAIVAGAAIIQGDVSIQLGFQSVNPSSFAIFVLEGAVGIAEIVVHGTGYIFAVCSAGIRTIHHIDAHSAVVQQFGHFGHLVVGAVAVEVVGHQVVVVGGFSEIHILGAIIGVAVLGVVGHVRVVTVTLGGPTPVAHDLSHGGGHATGDSLVAACTGTELVVGQCVCKRTLPACLGSDCGITC